MAREVLKNSSSQSSAGLKVRYEIDADATKAEIEAVVAQSQKRSAVYDIVTNPTSVVVEVA